MKMQQKSKSVYVSGLYSSWGAALGVSGLKPSQYVSWIDENYSSAVSTYQVLGFHDVSVSY